MAAKAHSAEPYDSAGASFEDRVSPEANSSVASISNFDCGREANAS